jgi:hypothetical protein
MRTYKSAPVGFFAAMALARRNGNAVRKLSLAIMLVAFAGPALKADTISTSVQAISSACICNGLPWDVGSQFNSGQVQGPGSVSEISGPFTDNYPGSNGSQYAEGWSSADSSGVLKAFSQVDATTPIPEVQADGHSYWRATILATCNTSVLGTLPLPSCGTTGMVTYEFGLDLEDSLVTGNYGQYGGGAFVNYDGGGVLALLAIHDGSPHAFSSTIITDTITVPVGTYFDIGADLTAQTQAQEGFATADASTTGLFEMQVLTPGGGYDSPEGTYATSFDTGAPEPGTAASGALGCLLLLLAARRLRVS